MKLTLYFFRKHFFISDSKTAYCDHCEKVVNQSFHYDVISDWWCHYSKYLAKN